MLNRVVVVRAQNRLEIAHLDPNNARYKVLVTEEADVDVRKSLDLGRFHLLYFLHYLLFSRLHYLSSSSIFHLLGRLGDCWLFLS